MRIHFDDARRPARVAKLLRAAFAAQGANLGLVKAQDLSARLYGYATFHELKASCGRHPASPWDEACTADIVAARRASQLAALVAAGLSQAQAKAFLDDVRPTARSRREAMAKIEAEPSTARDDIDLDSLLRAAIAEGATSVYIEARDGCYTAFIRLLGERIPFRGSTRKWHDSLIDSLKRRSGMNPAERWVGQDGKFQIDHSGKLHDLRVATIPAVEGEQAVILINQGQVQRGLEDLGITGLETWRKGIARRNGLCLVCGDAGSGRTVTMNASLRELDRAGRKIYSAQEVFERRWPHAGQVPMKASDGHVFKEAILTFMRGNQDVVAIGEIRDRNTAHWAIKAAEAGNLVIATLNAGNIASSVDRLRDLGILSSDLRFVLRSVIAQSLVKVVCPSCKALARPTKEGCDTCKVTGYADRTIISECHTFETHSDVDRFISHMDAERFTPIMEPPQGSRHDLPWTPMVDDGIAKMLAGTTTSDEVRRVLGSEFLERMAERGLDPAHYAAGRKPQPKADLPSASRPRGVAARRPAPPDAIMPIIRADDAIARWQAGEVTTRAMRSLFGDAFDRTLKERGIPIPRDDDAA